MSEISPIKKIVKDILKSKNTLEADRSIMHPAREWLLGLGVVWLGVIMAAWWSADTYLQFRDLEIAADEVVSEPVVYNAGLVEKALENYRLRQKSYETYVISPGEAVAPASEEVEVSDIEPVSVSEAENILLDDSQITFE